MPSSNQKILFLAALILLSVACTLSSSQDPIPRATITSIPTKPPDLTTPTLSDPRVTEVTVPNAPTNDNPLYTLTPGEGVTYFENFQRDQVPYWIFAEDSAFSYLEDGDLYIDLIEPDQYFIRPLTHLPEETNTIDLWARIPQATGRMGFGLACRLLAEDQPNTGYRFLVYTDNKFQIFADTPEGPILLHEGLITDPTFDLSSWTFFHLKCKEDQFYFTANGIPLFSHPITKAVYSGGYFGITIWGDTAKPYDQIAIQVFSASAP